jgi:hypothetical protein
MPEAAMPTRCIATAQQDSETTPLPRPSPPPIVSGFNHGLGGASYAQNDLGARNMHEIPLAHN